MSRLPTADEIRLWRAVMARPGQMVKPVRVARRSTVIDLHGFAVQDAFYTTIDFLRDIAQDGREMAMVITGRSGQIRREFSTWMEPLSFVAACREVDRGGAFRVTLRPR